MCIVSRRGPVEVANEDIKVYKVLVKMDGKLYPWLFYPKNAGEYNSSEPEMKLKDYKEVVVPIDKPLKSTKENIGYFCFGDFKDAVDFVCEFGEFIYTFVISKGAKYRRGVSKGRRYKSIILASKLCKGRKSTKQ